MASETTLAVAQMLHSLNHVVGPRSGFFLVLRQAISLYCLCLSSDLSLSLSDILGRFTVHIAKPYVAKLEQFVFGTSAKHLGLEGAI